MKGDNLNRGKIVYMDPNELIPYENNPRIHGDEIEELKTLITRFKFPPSKAIEVLPDMTVINGHGRRQAAIELGMTEVPVLIRDDLTDDEAKAYRIGDNRVSELSGWDYDLLSSEARGLKEKGWEFSDFGFDSFSFDDFGNGEAMDEDDPIEIPPKKRTIKDELEAEAQAEEEEADSEAETAIPATTDVKRGDVYLLGRHRLMCGDSTSRDDVATLMDGTKADITFTSPPYNMGHINTGRKRDRQKYENDGDVKDEAAYLKFLTDTMDIMLDASYEVFYNIGILKGSKRGVIGLLNEYKDEFKDFIYWRKSNPVPAIAKNTISSAIEPIMAFSRDNNSRTFRHDPGIYYGVIDGTVVSNNPYREIHRATFPMYLPTDIIEHFTDERGTVLDCFGGTGTTLMACEGLSRTCFTMEIDPLYCQCIIDRWEKETGQKAIKL